MSSPFVSICTQTFNHEPYIRQCLEGFVSQKTNFKFEVLINDDASTDGTNHIIKDYASRYPDIIKPYYQRVNQYSKGVNTFTSLLLPNAKGKYLCLCEGDDYWDDENKLQRQADFLEENNDYTICWTRYKILDESTGQVLVKPNEDDWFKGSGFHTVNFDNLFNPYLTLTLTLMSRMDVMKSSDLSNFNYFKDNTIYALALSKGKGAILDFYSAVYRLHGRGVWSSSNISRQLMQDYYNFNEIYRQIPGANTTHIRAARDNKLTEALNKVHLYRGDLKQYKQLVQEMLKTGNISNRVKYLLKYVLYKLKG